MIELGSDVNDVQELSYLLDHNKSTAIFYLEFDKQWTHSNLSLIYCNVGRRGQNFSRIPREGCWGAREALINDLTKRN